MNTPTGDVPNPPRRNIRVERETLQMWADHYGTQARVARLNRQYVRAAELQDLADRAARDLAQLEVEANA